MYKRATLKDIATALNVSTTTVSRALNNKSDISDEMRKKVWEVARILNYKPNSLARSLRQQSSDNVIGVILPEVDHYFFSTIIKGITSSIDKNFLIMIGETNHDLEREKSIIDQYLEHFVAGIILLPTRHVQSIANIKTLIDASIPLIVVDRTIEDYEGNYLRHDSFLGAQQAIDHLIQKGRKKIALLRGALECSVSADRVRGYKASLKNHGFEIEEHLIKVCPNTSKKEAFMACNALFTESDNPPDAIFTVTDHMAAGVYEYAHKAELRIPQDLAVVGYSNSEISDVLSPKLTTVGQDGFELGKNAKAQLIQIIEHPQFTCRQILPSSLIVRDSS